MPELRLKEVRLPELHLPEMTREDIGRTLDDVRRDLEKVELPRIDKVEMPRIDVTSIDIPKAVAAATRGGRPARRWQLPRVPLLLGGLLIFSFVMLAVLSSPAVRPRLEELGRKARQRMDERMAERDEMETAESHAFDDAVAVPIEPSAYAGYAGDAPTTGSRFEGSTERPNGLGSATDAGETTSTTSRPG
jgi:hypothetical protein